MINRTNQIMTLENGKEYFVFRQVVYKNVTYYITVEVRNNASEFEEKIIVLEEINDEKGIIIKKVKDQKIISTLIKNVKID